MGTSIVSTSVTNVVNRKLIHQTIICCIIVAVCLPWPVLASSYKAEKRDLLALGYSFSAYEPSAIYCPVFLEQKHSYHGNWIRLYHPKTEDLYYVGTRRPIKEPDVFIAGLRKSLSTQGSNSFYRKACVAGLRAWLYSEFGDNSWSESAVSPVMRKQIVKTLKDLQQIETDTEVLREISVALKWEMPRTGKNADQLHSLGALDCSTSVPLERLSTQTWFGAH